MEYDVMRNLKLLMLQYELICRKYSVYITVFVHGTLPVAENTISSPTRIEYEVGDIQDRLAVQKVLHGIQCVIHTASIVDISMIPNASLMWSVNCRGTKQFNLCLHFVSTGV